MKSLGFTFPEMEDNYTVSYSQDEGGMEILYDITNIFLDAVIGGNFFPDGFLSEEKFPDLESVSSNFPTEVMDNVQPILVANIPILVCIVLGILLAVISLICGIVFCCCCRAKNQTSDDNGFKKLMLSILLFILLVVTSLGCMWFFLGAKTSQNGLNKIPEDITDILHDGDLYMNNTVDELKYLLNDNFDEVIGEFTIALQTISDNFANFTEKMKTDINFHEIMAKADSFVDLIGNYSTIYDDTTIIIESMKSMNDKLKEVCENAAFVEVCKQADIVDQFPTDLFQLPELPGDTSQQISELPSLLAEIETKIDSMSANVIEDYFPTIEEEIAKIKNFLTEALDGFTEPIEDIQNQIFRNNEMKNTLEDIRDKYFPYFSISLYVLGSLLVAILAVFMIGMCLGSCSKNGSGTASTCSGIMFFANAIFFLLAIVLFILCTAFFAVGALGEKALCKTMENPGDSEIVNFVNPLLSSEMSNIYNNIAEGDFEVKFDLAEIISDIHNNTAIYPLLQLHYIFDIENLTDWSETYEIDPLIDDAKKDILNVLGELQHFQDSLDENEINIIDIAKIIDDLPLSALVGQSLLDSLVELQKNIEILQNAADGTPMETTVNQTVQEFIEFYDKVESLQTTLQNILNDFGDGSSFTMTQNVNETFALIDEAFAYFQGTSVMDFFDECVDTLTKVVDDYVAHAIDAANNHIGNTKPLSNIYNATYTDICIDIVAPFNSVWSGLGWCLLMILIPVTLLVTSVRKIFSASQSAPSMRPQDTNGYKNSRNPAARAVSYEEVPMPAYNERSARINAYDSRASSYQNKYQPSAPPPYTRDGRYQSATRR